jgi:uncharacterized protein (DUF1684 family)
MISHHALAVPLTAFFIAAALPLPNRAMAPDPGYVKKVEEWRARHEADYIRDFVPLAGLFYLDKREHTAGSAATNDFVLPGRAPAAIGRFIHEGDVTAFEPAPNVTVTYKGQPVVARIVLRPDGGSDPADELVVGDIALWVHRSGDRRAIRMRDPQGDVARSFAGFRWFPVDERYRTIGRFIKDPAPRELRIPSLSGDDQIYTTEGVVEFTLDGQKLRLRPMTTRPGRLFFIFRDATSGRETYEAARFLYADLGSDGTTTVDFNEAYNPPCAFNPYTTCPLPLPENRLKVRIPAGERAYAGKIAKTP